VAAFLAAKVAGANVADAAGVRALYAALHGNHAEVVQLLLAAGANPNAPLNQDQRSPVPLHLAVMNGSVACVAALLEGGAHPLPRASSLAPPLFAAAHGGHAEALRLLLAAEPAAALVHCNGRSPLVAALEMQHVEAACCLLADGPLPLPQQRSKLLKLLAGLGEPAHALYPILADRQPLTRRQWIQVPVPCPGLGTALPAVLEHSAQQARCLVRHLLTASACAPLRCAWHVPSGSAHSCPHPLCGGCLRCLPARD